MSRKMRGKLTCLSGFNRMQASEAAFSCRDIIFPRQVPSSKVCSIQMLRAGRFKHKSTITCSPISSLLSSSLFALTSPSPSIFVTTPSPSAVTESPSYPLTRLAAFAIEKQDLSLKSVMCSYKYWVNICVAARTCLTYPMQDLEPIATAFAY